MSGFFPGDSVQIIQWILFSATGGLMAMLLSFPGSLAHGVTIGAAISDDPVFRKQTTRGLILFLSGFPVLFLLLDFAFPPMGRVIAAGAYLLFTLIPLLFLIQAALWFLSCKIRSGRTAGSVRGLMLITGTAGMVVAGSAAGALFHGFAFTTDPVVPGSVRWSDSLRGLEVMANWRNLAAGVMLLFLGRLLGGLRAWPLVREHAVSDRLRKTILADTFGFGIFFVVFSYLILTIPGYSWHPVDGFISGNPFKYFNNLLNMPAVLAAYAAGFIFILLGAVLALFTPAKNSRSGAGYALTGGALAMTALLCLTGLNHTAYFPSAIDPSSSLTIRNSSAGLSLVMVTSIATLVYAGSCLYYFRKYLWFSRA